MKRVSGIVLAFAIALSTNIAVPSIGSAQSNCRGQPPRCVGGTRYECCFNGQSWCEAGKCYRDDPDEQAPLAVGASSRSIVAQLQNPGVRAPISLRTDRP